MPWVRFSIRLALFILSPLPWASSLLQTFQFAVWVMLLVGITQAHRIEPLRDVIQSVPGGTPTIVIGSLALLVLVAAWRLFYRLDRRAELVEIGKSIHGFIQDGSSLQNRIAIEAPSMLLAADVSMWMIHARSLIFEAFSEPEASRFEHSIGFEGGDRKITQEKLSDAMERRLEFLYELQGRIADRLWSLRP